MAKKRNLAELLAKFLESLESILLALITLILIFIVILIVILIISGIIHLIYTEQFHLLLGVISVLIMFACLTYGFYKR